MEAAEAKVQKVLQGDKQFLVPHFQRPYSWRERLDRATWPGAIAWLTTMAVAFKRAFTPRVAALDLPSNG